MRLSEFINTHRQDILKEWAAFAGTCLPASAAMDLPALQDHANEMLSVIAADLETPQTAREQTQKSKGNAPAEELPTAAHEHGADRAQSGFTMDQMVSEYRALRASVVRLWTRQAGALGPEDVEDLTRFNEAIDQALAESIARYSHDLDRSREMFLAILGHDLRTPLGAVITSATFMLELNELEEPYRTLTDRIASSSRRMDRMVGDLLDLTRSRLGGGIPVEPADMDMNALVRDVVAELSSVHPDGVVEIHATGDLSGRWDRERMSQVLTNLVGNALEHGGPDHPVRLDISGDPDAVTLTVHNRGPSIPASLVERIFDPMKPRLAPRRGATSGSSAHLGLGLYIAERIVKAHEGTIEVTSSEADGTTFTVQLPRRG